MEIKRHSQEEDIAKVLFSAEKIKAKVEHVAKKLAVEYRDLSPVLICTLKGSFVFFADLVRAIRPCPANLEIDFLNARSYGNEQETSGNVTIDKSCSINLTGRNVLLVDDICDSGLTLKCLTDVLKEDCASIKTVVLLDKIENRRISYTPDYTCFQCPDEFVVGYGLDFAQRYRTLPYVGVLKRSAVERVKQSVQEYGYPIKGKKPSDFASRNIE